MEGNFVYMLWVSRQLKGEREGERVLRGLAQDTKEGLESLVVKMKEIIVKDQELVEEWNEQGEKVSVGNVELHIPAGLDCAPSLYPDTYPEVFMSLCLKVADQPVDGDYEMVYTIRKHKFDTH